MPPGLAQLSCAADLVPAVPACPAAGGGPSRVLRLFVDPAATPRHPTSQAHKRGLDVDKLHGSRTPAWRNLRGRSASQRKRSYYEGPEPADDDDEVEDQPSGSEEEEEVEEEEEEQVGGSWPAGQRT